ncbi:c-type cytochrome [Minwuia sp.]|uniref:c-type cytochrome n=1 Tax=Minwuia sp. TaxID=2493630 RepID=UPI003A934B1C
MNKKILTMAAMGLALGIGTAHAEGDPAAGEKVFKKCKICHKVEEGKNSPVGPNLYGIFGREAGKGDFKRYSTALKNSGIVWNEETIAAYLKDPKGYIPKNKMAFPGLKKDKDVENVIAYLKQVTQ